MEQHEHSDPIPRRHWALEDIRPIVAAYRASGMSMVAFAAGYQDIGVTAKAIGRWCRRVHRAEAAAVDDMPQGFCPVAQQQRQLHDAGTRRTFDRRDAFDTPQLTELWRTAPFLHDGSTARRLRCT